MIEAHRIAINQATTRLQWDFRQSVEGYARHGVRKVAVWRDKIEACGLAGARRLLAENGMSVTGVNRAGPLMPESGDYDAAFDDARRAVDVTAELQADCLLVFPGGLLSGSKDIAESRRRLRDITAELLEFARRTGVVLALEPLHPMLAADRSCLNTMAEANDLCDALGPGLAIVVDVYHVWWDPNLEAEIERAGKARLAGFHVNDWLLHTRDLLTDRGMMGDGVIDIPRIRHMLDRARYDGPVEVEIFSSENWWKRDPDEVVRICLERCRTAV